MLEELCIRKYDRHQFWKILIYLKLYVPDIKDKSLKELLQVPTVLVIFQNIFQNASDNIINMWIEEQGKKHGSCTSEGGATSHI